MKASTSMRRTIAASFADDHDLVGATRATRAAGVEIVDAFGPFAAHGIDEAIGRRATRLPWACFLLGTIGVALALWLQYWTSAVDWPINVGGKPFDSLPAFIPVVFELCVLLAALGTVLAFFVRSRLRPGRRAIMPHVAVTDDRFVLVVRERRGPLDLAGLRELWRPFGLVEISEGLEEVTS